MIKYVQVESKDNFEWVSNWNLVWGKAISLHMKYDTSIEVSGTTIDMYNQSCSMLVELQHPYDYATSSYKSKAKAEESHLK